MTFLVFSVLPAPDSPLPGEPSKFSGERWPNPWRLPLSHYELYCLPFCGVPVRDPTASSRKRDRQTNAKL